MDERKSPRHQVSVRSFMDLPCHLSLDCTARYVDSLPAIAIPSYLTVDARLGWRPSRNLELALVGQNLADNRHAEFSPSFIATQRTQIERSFYAKVTWHF